MFGSFVYVTVHMHVYSSLAPGVCTLKLKMHWCRLNQYNFAWSGLDLLDCFHEGIFLSKRIAVEMQWWERIELNRILKLLLNLSHCNTYHSWIFSFSFALCSRMRRVFALLLLSSVLAVFGQKLPTRDEGLFQMQIRDKALFHDSSVIPDGAEISGYLFRDTPKRYA